MEKYDPAMAARVWKRVRGEEEAPPPDRQLQTLMEEAWEDANLYRHLSRRHRGRNAALLQQLHRQTMEHLRLLKGICALTDQCDPIFPSIPPRREPEGITLRRGYGRALQRLSWYSSHENDAQFGHVLAQLIRQTQQHTRILLQLMSRPAGNARG